MAGCGAWQKVSNYIAVLTSSGFCVMERENFMTWNAIFFCSCLPQCLQSSVFAFNGQLLTVSGRSFFGSGKSFRADEEELLMGLEIFIEASSSF